MVAMPQRELRYITEEEYRELETTSEVKHEYFNGEIFDMAGGTNKHAVIGGNVYAALHKQLRGKSCRPVGSDQMVKIEATHLSTYADIAVYCKGARFEGKGDQVLLTPVVLVEVLSPSTANYDRGEKFDHYKQMPSLCDYVIVWQDCVRVEHYHRLENGDWLLHSAWMRDDTIALESVGATLALGDVYEDVDVPSGPLLLRRDEVFPELDSDG